MLFTDHCCEIKCDRVMITDPHILASKPDILLFDKPNKTVELIDISALLGKVARDCLSSAIEVELKVERSNSLVKPALSVARVALSPRFDSVTNSLYSGIYSEDKEGFSINVLC